MRGRLAAESSCAPKRKRPLRVTKTLSILPPAPMTNVTPANHAPRKASRSRGRRDQRCAHGVAARLIAALKNDEFSLYSQAITPLGAAGEGASFCEVLLRLKEEEENLLPPGSFLPIAEENGLMPQVDRWVVRNVLNAAAVECHGNDPVYFVNVAAATVAEATLAGSSASLPPTNSERQTLCLGFPRPT